MPCFACEKCKCIENTATSDYWTDKHEKKPLLCSECKAGKWHKRFKKTTAVGQMIGDDGFLYDAEEVKEGGYFWPHIKSGRLKIVGRVI